MTDVNRYQYIEKLYDLILQKRKVNCFFFSREKYIRVLNEAIVAK